MAENDNLRYTTMPLNNRSGAMPALGFGTLIPDPVATRTATKAALEAGFRQLDASERYRNEKEVGEAIQEVFKATQIKRADVFIATKVWNNNHRPGARQGARLRGQPSMRLSARLRRIFEFHSHAVCFSTRETNKTRGGMANGDADLRQG